MREQGQKGKKINMKSKVRRTSCAQGLWLKSMHTVRPHAVYRPERLMFQLQPSQRHSRQWLSHRRVGDLRITTAFFPTSPAHSQREQGIITGATNHHLNHSRLEEGALRQQTKGKIQGNVWQTCLFECKAVMRTEAYRGFLEAFLHNIQHF